MTNEEFEALVNSQIPPTMRQQHAASVISNVLNISLPDEFSFTSYSEYISKYMAQSRAITRSRQSTRRIPDFRKAKWRAQREADWEAAHIDSEIYAQRILDGEVLPPSWSNMTLLQMQQRMRSLGYKSSLEQELDRLKEQQSGWCGLEGSPEEWG